MIEENFLHQGKTLVRIWPRYVVTLADTVIDPVYPTWIFLVLKRGQLIKIADMRSQISVAAYQIPADRCSISAVVRSQRSVIDPCQIDNVINMPQQIFRSGMGFLRSSQSRQKADADYPAAPRRSGPACVSDHR